MARGSWIRLLVGTSFALGSVSSASAQRRIVAQWPLEVDRHRAIMQVQIGRRPPLRLILDSGMPYDGILVFDSARVDRSSFANLVRAQVAGAGGGAASRVLTDSAASFTVGGLPFDRQRVTILTSAGLRGFPTDGVIGYSLLGHFAVELDYDLRRVTLYDAATFVPDSGWQSVPISFRDDRVPWLQLPVSTAGEPPVTLEVYIDCAAGSALELLERATNKFVMPAMTAEVEMGRGLSGDIRSRVARVQTVRLGRHELRDVKTLVAPAAVRSRRAGADAIIGNDLLRRFNVVFDYAHQKVHLKPNRAFAEPFR